MTGAVLAFQSTMRIPFLGFAVGLESGPAGGAR